MQEVQPFLKTAFFECIIGMTTVIVAAYCITAQKGRSRFRAFGKWG